MAALTLFIFSLFVSTALAVDDNRVVEKEERPAFQALPLQFAAAEQKEFYFHLYFNEVFDGQGKTTEVVASPNPDEFPNFAEVDIMDVPLYDSLTKNKVIARAQGSSMQANQKTYGWSLNYNFVFEQPAQLKGSTLQVMGNALQLTTPREWSIVGGTGVFTLAKGVVYGRLLSSPDESLWVELKLYGYYTPMQQPPWN